MSENSAEMERADIVRLQNIEFEQALLQDIEREKLEEERALALERAKLRESEKQLVQTEVQISQEQIPDDTAVEPENAPLSPRALREARMRYFEQKRKLLHRRKGRATGLKTSSILNSRTRSGPGSMLKETRSL